RNAAPGSGFDDLGPHAVAVLETVGNVKIGDAAGDLDGALENDDGGGAVDIVIAVDKNFLFIANGARQTFESAIHAAQGERIVEIVERRAKKTPGGVSVAKASATKHAGGRIPDA